MRPSMRRSIATAFSSSGLAGCSQDVRAVGVSHVAAGGVIGTVPGARTFDADHGANLEGSLRNAPAHRRSRGCGGKSPRRGSSVLVFHVDIEPDVRILPLDLLQDAGDLHRL